MRNFRFLQPEDIPSVLKIKQDEQSRAHILAGGTNLISYIKIGQVKQGVLIDITRISDMKQVKEEEGKVSIGAGVTIKELIDNALVQRKLPGFWETLFLFANPLIRNKATIGGNLADASPIADTAPILLALDAEVVAESSGANRVIPLKDFFTGPGTTVLKGEEVVTRVMVPCFASSKVKMLKMGLRNGTACSVTSVAVRLDIDGAVKEARVALGGVAPTPMRSKSCEEKLSSMELNRKTIEAAAGAVLQDICPISDVRGTAEYRNGISVPMTRKALSIAAGVEV